MARLDVYPMPGKRPGLLLDVQSDLLGELRTRVVVPLRPPSAGGEPFSDLNPIFDVAGKEYVMVTQAIVSIPLKELGRAVASLPHEHDDVVRALDLLLIGL